MNFPLMKAQSFGQTKRNTVQAMYLVLAPRLPLVMHTYAKKTSQGREKFLKRGAQVNIETAHDLFSEKHQDIDGTVGGKLSSILS